MMTKSMDCTLNIGCTPVAVSGQMCLPLRRIEAAASEDMYTEVCVNHWVAGTDCERTDGRKNNGT